MCLYIDILSVLYNLKFIDNTNFILDNCQLSVLYIFIINNKNFVIESAKSITSLNWVLIFTV